MTEAAPPQNASQNAATQRLLVDLGPVIAFMIAYNLANRFAAAGQAIYWGTGVFVAATLAALGYAWLKERRLPPMLLVTGVVVLTFGGLTLWLRDPVFIKMKPTIVNLLYASAIFGGLLVGQNVWRLLFEGAFPGLPDATWRSLAVRWGVFFVFLAGLNEFVWRTFSETFWANFKVFGVLPITFLFALGNIPLLMQARAEPPAQPES